MPFSVPTTLKANKSRQTTAVGGAATAVVGARRYALNMRLIDRAEARRKSALAAMDPAEQAALGQYFTPYQAALIIAGLPRVPQTDAIRVLDPGAGSGMLTVALVDRIRAERPGVPIEVTAVEVDETLRPALRETLSDIEALGNVTTTLIGEDFLTWALASDDRFDLVIQNPPYAKLQTGSAQQNLLRAAGIDVPNIYAAFLALGVRLLAGNGQQVAITPRSWMNGTYYSRFRREFVDTVGIDGIHAFESRSKVFGDTGVLQEAIVVSVTRGERPDAVQVYTSHDHRDDATVRCVAYDDVVTADFVHVPATEKDAEAVAWMTHHAHHTLAELGLTISTGRVVDFRSRDMLHHTDPALAVLHAFGTPEFDDLVTRYLEEAPGLLAIYRAERDLTRIPVTLPGGVELTLGAGGQNVLIKQMIDDFSAYFIPAGEVLYIGDADSKLMHFDEEKLAQLGVVVNTHGKLPDLVVYQPEKNWLFLMEAASSHGPIDAKRYGELSTLFAGSSAGLVYVSCFPDRAVMRKFLADLAWETEAWCASDPTHMIHLNGDKFLGPHEVSAS